MADQIPFARARAPASVSCERTPCFCHCAQHYFAASWIHCGPGRMGPGARTNQATPGLAPGRVVGNVEAGVQIEGSPDEPAQRGDASGLIRNRLTLGLLDPSSYRVGRIV